MNATTSASPTPVRRLALIRHDRSGFQVELLRPTPPQPARPQPPRPRHEPERHLELVLRNAS
jgi:hypothetical protein